MVFPQHIPVKPILDPLAGCTMDAARLAGTKKAPAIGVRVIVKDASIICRFFDGLDWVSDTLSFHCNQKAKHRVMAHSKIFHCQRSETKICDAI